MRGIEAGTWYLSSYRKENPGLEVGVVDIEVEVLGRAEDLGGGVLSHHPSVLTAPEADSYASAILYYQLSLAVDTLLLRMH